MKEEIEEKLVGSKTVSWYNQKMRQTGIQVYRKIGKVRVAVPGTMPQSTVNKAIKVVKLMAPATPEILIEPTRETMLRWRDDKFVAHDVCDDPMPKSPDLNTCPIEELVNYTERWHFRLIWGPNDEKMSIMTLDKFDEKTIREFAPSWFSGVCRKRLKELESYLKANHKESDGDNK